MAGTERRHGARRRAEEGETAPTPGTRRPRPLTRLRLRRREPKGEQGRRRRLTQDGRRQGGTTPLGERETTVEEGTTTTPGTRRPRPPSRLRPRQREPEGERGRRRRQDHYGRRQGGTTPRGERARRREWPTRQWRRGPPQTGRERLTRAAGEGGTTHPSGRKGGTKP